MTQQGTLPGSDAQDEGGNATLPFSSSDPRPPNPRPPNFNHKWCEDCCAMTANYGLDDGGPFRPRWCATCNKKNCHGAVLSYNGKLSKNSNTSAAASSSAEQSVEKAQIERNIFRALSRLTDSAGFTAFSKAPEMVLPPPIPPTNETLARVVGDEHSDWACAACTLVNPCSASSCKMCTTPRMSLANTEDANLDKSEAPPFPDRNKMVEDKCIDCEAGPGIICLHRLRVNFSKLENERLQEKRNKVHMFRNRPSNAHMSVGADTICRLKDGFEGGGSKKASEMHDEAPAAAAVAAAHVHSIKEDTLPAASDEKVVPEDETAAKAVASDPRKMVNCSGAPNRPRNWSILRGSKMEAVPFETGIPFCQRLTKLEFEQRKEKWAAFALGSNSSFDWNKKLSMEQRCKHKGWAAKKRKRVRYGTSYGYEIKSNVARKRKREDGKFVDIEISPNRAEVNEKALALAGASGFLIFEV
jgi:hypothetical protein